MLLNSDGWRDRVTACLVMGGLHKALSRDLAHRLSFLMWEDTSREVRLAAARALGRAGEAKVRTDSVGLVGMCSVCTCMCVSPCMGVCGHPRYGSVQSPRVCAVPWYGSVQSPGTVLCSPLLWVCAVPWYGSVQFWGFLPVHYMSEKVELFDFTLVGGL